MTYMQPTRVANPSWCWSILLAAAATPLAPAGGIALPAMDGVSITSYTVNGSTPGRAGATSTSLTFSNTDNGSFDPTLVFGSTTGDFVSGGDWTLSAVGADYGFFVALPVVNTIGASMSAGPDFASGDGISLTFVLVFTKAQSFYGVNNLGEANVGIDSATLARDGGATTNLLTATPGEIFAAGTYTLSMAGTGTGGSNMGLYASFLPDAVPGGGIAVLVGVLGGLRGSRRR